MKKPIKLILAAAALFGGGVVLYSEVYLPHYYRTQIAELNRETADHRRAIDAANARTIQVMRRLAYAESLLPPAEQRERVEKRKRQFVVGNLPTQQELHRIRSLRVLCRELVGHQSSDCVAAKEILEAG